MGGMGAELARTGRTAAGGSSCWQCAGGGLLAVPRGVCLRSHLRVMLSLRASDLVDVRTRQATALQLRVDEELLPKIEDLTAQNARNQQNVRGDAG